MKDDSEVFDRAKLVRLKRAYEKAKMQDKDTFEFEGKDYVLDYAKYLIEYLAYKLKVN